MSRLLHCSAFLFIFISLAGELVLPPPSYGAEPQPPIVIKQILIRGQKMVEEATIRSRIQSREGAPFDPEQTTRDVRAIYELGYFEDIKVEAEGFEGGIRLIFNLTEKPLIRAIEFEGNKKVKNEELREKLDLADRTVYDPAAISRAVQRLKALYRKKGFYHVMIEARTETVREGEVQLVFTIQEGKKYRITTLRFSGNRAFSESELRRRMKTKTWGLFSFLTASGRLKQEILQEDRQRLLNYYQDHGYLEARVGEPEITVRDQERRLEILISITEGEQYRLGKLDLSGDTLIPLEDILELIQNREGEIFRRSAFAQDLFKIKQLYTRRGYAYVKVDYSSKLDPAKKTIDITLLLDKGEKIRIGRINITGNITTRDKVLRRELTFHEGDIFNSDALRRSRQKIINLGFFESVDLIPRPGEENSIDIDIEVKERLTGAISFGLGYSSEEKLAGQLRLSHSNLFGRGQSIQILGEYGTLRKDYSFSFSEPALLDSRYSLGFKIYDILKEYAEYDRMNIGGKITLGRTLGEYFRGFVSVKHESVEVSNLTEDVSSFIKTQEGKKTTNSLQLTLVRDSRDNYFNPSTGNRTVLTGEYAGGSLEGDNYFTKVAAETSFYFPLFWKLVLKLHGAVGAVNGFDGREPPIYERFFLGGIHSVRGFEPRSIGPKDENGDPLGGYKKLVLNTEFILPLVPEEGLNAVFFFDAGNAFDKGESYSLSTLRTGAGMGIRWLSPLGPFRLEWGYNLNPKKGEPSGDWAFTIGTFF